MKRINNHTTRTLFDRYHHYLLTGLCLLIIAISMIISGCDLTFPDYDKPKAFPAASSDAPAVLPIFVVDDEGTPLETVDTIDPATVLYDVHHPDNTRC